MKNILAVILSDFIATLNWLINHQREAVLFRWYLLFPILSTTPYLISTLCSKSGIQFILK